MDRAGGGRTLHRGAGRTVARPHPFPTLWDLFRACPSGLDLEPLHFSENRAVCGRQHAAKAQAAQQEEALSDFCCSVALPIFRLQQDGLQGLFRKTLPRLRMEVQYHAVKESGAAKLARDLVAAAFGVIASAGAAAGCCCHGDSCHC